MNIINDFATKHQSQTPILPIYSINEIKNATDKADKELETNTDIVKAAKEYKDKGNSHYKATQIYDACQSYIIAIHIISKIPLTSMKIYNEVTESCFNNILLCIIALKDLKSTIYLGKKVC